ncbi:kinase-like protein [Tothia fuscella]|uniref:non-specific serine/threonine protein kinase n=1 Tax=Tothia fuscella TaxID=1048955 RepID=A0A9P4P113_9PEZI|nr:kinase-like protein [Tothia fuscella]
MVFDFYAGGDLHDLRVRNQDFQLPESLLWHLLHQMCEARAWLHEGSPRKIIHRDIKPENWLLDLPGPFNTEAGIRPRLRLTDFGMAIFEDQRENSSTFAWRDWIGAPNYWPPEQARRCKLKRSPTVNSPRVPKPGRGDTNTMASEIWAIGALVYEIATHQVTFVRPLDWEWMGAFKLFTQTSFAERRVHDLNDIKKIEPVGPVSWQPYTEQLNKVLRFALEFDPHKRARAGELLRLIERVRKQVTSNAELKIPWQPECPERLSPDHCPEDFGA